MTVSVETNVGGGGGAAIGSSVALGTAKSVLYVDASGNLGQDNARFNWDDSAHTLAINGNVLFTGIADGSAPNGGFYYSTTASALAFKDSGGTVHNLLSGGGVAIGNPVTSGTAKSVLFVDGSGNLGQDNSKFNWDDSAHTLNINGSPVAVNLPSVYNLKTDGGCKFDYKIVNDGVMTTGGSPTTLTSATAGFAAGDVGKKVFVGGAGVAGVGLSTTIAAFTNSTTVTLTTGCSTSVTSARVAWGTDDTAAIQAGITAANGLPIYFPPGNVLVSATSGNLFTIGAGQVFFGAGRTVTNVYFADYVALTANGTIFQSASEKPLIRDLTIIGGVGVGGFNATSAQSFPAGGTGYTVGDLLTVTFPTGYNGPVNTIARVTTVGASNAVTAIALSGSGAIAGTWTTAPANTLALATTGGTGTGCTIALNFNVGVTMNHVGFTTGAFRGLVDSVETTNMYGGGVSIVQNWLQVEYTTTLGTGVSAGTWATCTPASMNGIYPGRRIDIDTATKVALLSQPATVGTGYLVGDTVTLTGGSGGGLTQAILLVTAVQAISATIGAGGSGYADHDILNVSGGTLSASSPFFYGIPAQFKIRASGGAATAVESMLSGGSYTTTPTNNAATTDTTTTAGTGCTLNITWGAINQVGAYGCTGTTSVQAGGSGYAIGDILSVTNPTSGGMPTFVSVRTVNAGVVTGVGVLVPGTFAAAPNNPVTMNTITGVGSGCTLNLTYAVTANPPGTPVSQGIYPTPPANAVSQGSSSGSGTTATFNVFFNPEQIIVQSITANTFAAAFANAHLSTVTCTLSSEGRSFHTVQNCHIHDGYYANGIGLAARSNRFLNNRIVNIGVNSLQHGVYNQGGDNTYENNYIAGCSGYGIQLHMSTPNMDAGGCKVIGNTFVDCQYGWFTVDTAASPIQITNPNSYQANPQIPIGEWVTRHAIIKDNYFKHSNQLATSFGATLIVNSSGGAIIEGNIFEDGNVNIQTGAYTVVKGNKFRCLNGNIEAGLYGATQVIASANYCLVEGNTFENIQGSLKIIDAASTGCIVRNNIINASATYSGKAIGIGGNNVEVDGNILIGPAGMYFDVGGLTGWKIHDNDLSASTGTIVLNNTATNTGEIYNNAGAVISLAATVQPGVVIYNNDGRVSDGIADDTLTRACGRMINGSSLTSHNLTHGLTAKYDANGYIIPCTTTDTTCAGIAPTSTNGTYWTVLSGQTGTEYPTATVDAGGCTSGNIGIMSTATAGKWKDTGSTTLPGWVTINGVGIAAAGTGYAPADTITLTATGATTASVLTVATTTVVSATIHTASGGTGGTTGPQTVTGTTGTGTKYTAQVQVLAGAATAVNSILSGGAYTINPTLVGGGGDPVTGGNLTGCILDVVMGVNTLTVTTGGVYTGPPTNPAAQASSSGGGTGSTFNIVWGPPSMVRFLATVVGAGTARVQIIKVW